METHLAANTDGVLPSPPAMGNGPVAARAALLQETWGARIIELAGNYRVEAYRRHEFQHGAKLLGLSLERFGVFQRQYAALETHGDYERDVSYGTPFREALATSVQQPVIAYRPGLGGASYRTEALRHFLHTGFVHLVGVDSDGQSAAGFEDDLLNDIGRLVENGATREVGESLVVSQEPRSNLLRASFTFENHARLVSLHTNRRIETFFPPELDRGYHVFVLTRPNSDFLQQLPAQQLTRILKRIVPGGGILIEDFTWRDLPQSRRELLASYGFKEAIALPGAVEYWTRLSLRGR